MKNLWIIQPKEISQYKKKFNKLTSAVKKYYYNREFNEHKSNLRYLWKLINEVINRNKLTSKLPDHFKDSTEISNKFNEYFINVGPNLASKIPVSDMNFRIIWVKDLLNLFSWIQLLKMKQNLKFVTLKKTSHWSWWNTT